MTQKLPTSNDNVKAASTDDLLHLIAVMVGKAEREPQTADVAIAHAQRAFDVLVERIG